MRRWLAVMIPVVILSAFFLVTFQHTLDIVAKERAEEPKLPEDIGAWQKRETCDLSGNKVLTYAMFDKHEAVDPNGVFLAKVDGRLVVYQIGSTNESAPRVVWVRHASGTINTHYITGNEKAYDDVKEDMREAIESHGINFDDLVPCN